MIFLVGNAVMVTMRRWVYLKEFRLVIKPKILKPPVLYRAYQPFIKVVRLVLAGINIEVGADNGEYLEVRTPGVVLFEFYVQFVICVEYFKGGVCKIRNCPSCLFLYRIKKGL